MNRGSGYNDQALYSYKLRFEFTTPAGCLEYLNHREFTVADPEEIWFMKLFRRAEKS